MDDADRAQRDIEVLSNYFHRALEPVANATGQCLWCGKQLEKGMRWCDASCRDAWEKENERR